MAKLVARLNYEEAYHLALDLVKQAGFKLDHASSRTETCYYYHPSRHPFLIRLSTHKTKKSPIGLNNVVARVTFSRKDEHLSNRRVLDMLTYAIGQYFLNDPKGTRYRGPKGGAWEMDELSCHQAPN